MLGAVVGASALPGAVVAPPALLARGRDPGGGPRRPWARALAAFRRAEARLAARRAYEARLPALLRAFPFSEQLDEVFNDLECARLEALRRLLRVPAPDLRALSLKVDLTVDEEVASLDRRRALPGVLKADARRFARAVDPATGRTQNSAVCGIALTPLSWQLKYSVMFRRADDLSEAGIDLLASARGKRFGTILADPPWQFQNRTGKVAPEHKRLARYGTMTHEEICNLPVEDIAADPSHLYLWVPNALLPEGLR